MYLCGWWVFGVSLQSYFEMNSTLHTLPTWLVAINGGKDSCVFFHVNLNVSLLVHNHLGLFLYFPLNTLKSSG